MDYKKAGVDIEADVYKRQEFVLRIRWHGSLRLFR